jgi:hypothetical protein
MYLSFAGMPELLEDPEREALALAVMDDDAHGVSQVLWETTDLGHLLPDRFLTPTLMQMATSGSPALFRALGEFGFGFNTTLTRPDSDEDAMSLAHWAALSLPPERLAWLMEEKLLDPFEETRIPGQGNLYLSSLGRGMCEAKGDTLTFWLEEFRAALAGEREEGVAWSDDRVERFQRLEVPLVLRLLHGLERVAMKEGEKADPTRLDAVLGLLHPHVWEVEGKSPWAVLLANISPRLHDIPTLSRVCDWMEQHMGPPPSAALAPPQLASPAVLAVMLDRGYAPVDPAHLGPFIRHLFRDKDTHEAQEVWNRVVMREGRHHPAFATLPAFLKGPEGVIRGHEVARLGRALSHEHQTALSLYQTLPMASVTVRTARL